MVYNRWLHYYASFVAACTLFLIFAGGLVTSTDSGLSVPDWPLSFGRLFPPMKGGVFYEHGHRMVATAVGILTVALAAWLWKAEARRWLRRLGLLALLAVVTQGTLGGLTVLLHLPTSVSVGHAGLAQIFLCLTVSIAVFTSRGWLQERPRLQDDCTPPMRILAVAATAAAYAQTLFGALMRHTRSGLAIPDWPLSFGRLIPPEFTGPVVINFIHRTWAWVVAVLITWAIVRVLRTHKGESFLQGPAIALLGAVLFQIMLGAETVWSGRAVIPTTLHVATGAFVLATGVVLTLRTYRLFRAGPEVEPADEARARAA